MDTKPIGEFLMGDEITGFYYLARADLKSRRDRQGHYLAVDLSDASGEIIGHVWENAEQLAKEIAAGDVVKIQGSVQSFQGRKQLSIAKIRKTKPADDVDMSLLVAAVDDGEEKLWREYTRLAGTVVNPFLRSLLRKFVEDENFRQAFARSPGGASGQQSYLGGLIKHTLSVTKICENIAGLYADIDRDLLVSAALVHAVGKAQSFTQGPRVEMTDAGRLIGPVVLSWQMVQAKLREIPAFPAEIALRLQHLLLAQRGRIEGHQPAPQTPEAYVLSHAIRLDTIIDTYARAKTREHRDNVKWSQPIRFLDQQFYFGEK